VHLVDSTILTMGRDSQRSVWGRLEDAEDGRVHKLDKPAVSVGRREASMADILVEAVPNRSGEYFCSATQFELRRREGRSFVVDLSTNGTFLNLDEAAAERAFRNQRDERTWLAQQTPDPKLKKGREEQIFSGDCLFLRPSHDLCKFKKFVFHDGPGEDSDTSDGEGEDSHHVVPSSLDDDHRRDCAQATNEDDDDEENWAPLPGLFSGTKAVAAAKAPVVPSSTVKSPTTTPAKDSPASGRRSMHSTSEQPGEEAKAGPVSAWNTAGKHVPAASAGTAGKGTTKNDRARAAGNYQPLTIIASNSSAKSAQEPAEAPSSSRKRAHEAESPCNADVRQEREHAAQHSEERVSKAARALHGSARGATPLEPRDGDKASRKEGRQSVSGAGSGAGLGGRGGSGAEGRGISIKGAAPKSAAQDDSLNDGGMRGSNGGRRGDRGAGRGEDEIDSVPNVGKQEARCEVERTRVVENTGKKEAEGGKKEAEGGRGQQNAEDARRDKGARGDKDAESEREGKKGASERQDDRRRESEQREVLRREHQEQVRKLQMELVGLSLL